MKKSGGKGGKFYDDDYDDGYDDYAEEEYEEEGDWGSHPPSTQAAPGPPPKTSQLQASLPPPPGDQWRCPLCTYDNAPQHLACDMCGTPRPVEESARGKEVPVDLQLPDAPGKHPSSRLAIFLCSPLPPAPQKQVSDSSSRPGLATEPFVSQSSSAKDEETIVPFSFDSPSPDDQVLVARNRGTSSIKKPPALPSPSNGKPPPSKAPDSKTPVSAPKPYDPIRARRQSAPAFEGGSENKVEQSVREVKRLSLDDQASDRGQGEPSSSGRGDTSKGNRPPGKRQTLPLSSYRPDEELLAEIRKGGGEKDVLNLIIVGHVDAGKSTLMGRVLHALGQVSQKEMHKNEKQSKEQGKGSFAYAWVLDEGSEERARGVTMTVAVAHFETPHKKIVLLDAPGHRDFVPNMISGASQADAAILVVDATPGGYEAGMEGQGGQGGQTKEHAQLARSLGVEQLIVAVNKMDAIGFDQERFAEIQAGLAPFLRQCGYKDSAVRWLPVSGLAGENLTGPPNAKELASWYRGPDLITAVDSFAAPVRLVAKPLRLTISEVFKTRTLGSAAVGGKVEGGALKAGSKVLVMPAGEVATVKGVERNGETVSGASAGESVDVGLLGIEPNILFAGSVLCHPDYPVPAATRMEVRLLTLNIVMPLLRGASLVLHAHNAKEPVRVLELVSLLDPKSGQVAKSKPRVISKNQSAVVELVSERAICLEAYTDYRALGRIALRDSGRTVAVGIVTKILEA